jgi:hypothetical protein
MVFLSCGSPVSATLKVLLTLENAAEILKPPDPIYRRKITSVPNLGILDKLSNKSSRLPYIVTHLIQKMTSSQLGQSNGYLNSKFHDSLQYLQVKGGVT